MVLGAKLVRVAIYLHPHITPLQFPGQVHHRDKIVPLPMANLPLCPKVDPNM